MTAFRTGVHTIEFKTTEYLKTTELPTAYRNALEPLGSMRYKMNMTKLPGTKEYDTPADTQRAIREAFTMFASMGAGYPQTTRIDFRFDDHEGTYAQHLPMMTVLVNLIAHHSGIYDRRISRLDENDVKTSIRCMPEDTDHTTRYGIEYYDKLDQRGNAEHGNARLELRRVNMEGESVQFIVKEWRDILQSITRAKYLAMLEEHARSLHSTRQDGETATAFVRRMRSKLIAYEEQTKLYKISGKTANHYYEGLPKWEQVKEFIDDLTAQLDEALAQPESEHHQTVVNELPF